MRLPLLAAACCAILACAARPHCAEAAKARHFKWEISNMFWSPDCEEKVVIGINGQFPGPTIRARAGDTIHVELKNALHTEGVVIHWHGIRQIGTPWMDGTAAISQCAINPEETFTCRFVVDKPGTYFYHGHYGMQRAAGLYGSLIVDVPEGEEEPFKYDGELNLLLSDWYHESIHTQMVALSSKPFRWIGEPQGYPMTFLLENLGSIYSGETYSVLIKPDQDPNRSYWWLASNVISPNLSYYGGRSSLRRPHRTGPAWNDAMYRFRQSVVTVAHPAYAEPPPPRADRTILLLNTQNTINGRVKWALNNVSFTLPHTPYLVAMKNGFPGVLDQRPPPETYAHVGEPQSLLINGRGRFVNCCTIATGACNATLPECAMPVFAVVPGKTDRFRVANLTSLSAVNFEIIEGYDKDAKALLVAYASTSITIETVASATTRTRPPTIAFGAVLVFVMLYLLAAVSVSSPSAAEARSRHPVADQEAAAAEGTITRSTTPAPSASDSPPPPAGGDQTPLLRPQQSVSSSPSGTGPADSNPSGTPSTPRSEGSDGNEEDHSGPPGSPSQSPVTTTSVGVRDNEGPLLSFVTALWAYDAAVLVGIYLRGFETIVGGWSTGPKVVYVVSAALVIALLLVAFMAAGCHVSNVAGNMNMLWVSAFSVKLGAILSSDLLLVAISCKLGRWGCVAAVPSAAVMTIIMAAMWIWGNHRAVVSAVGRLHRRRDDMV